MQKLPLCRGRIKLLCAIVLSLLLLTGILVTIDPVEESVQTENSTQTPLDTHLASHPFIPEAHAYKKLADNAQESLCDNPPLQDKPASWQTIDVRRGDTITHIFTEKLGLSHQTLQEVLTTNKLAKKLIHLKPGQSLNYRLTENGQLDALALDLSLTESLHVQKFPAGFDIKKIQKPIDTRLAFLGNRIEQSLFHAGQKAGIHDSTLMSLANIFAWDVDFALDIRENDHFKIVLEEQFVENNKLNTGPILAAEFSNQGKQHHAIRYQAGHHAAQYYSPEGYSLQQAFIRTPLNFTRISSHFNPKRKHPILNTIRAHKGVDYAAPKGTPIKATGNAKIQFIGKKGGATKGYGNFIVLDHGRGYTTLYAHLSRFQKNLKRGQTVKQGDVIGYVGATGLASAPHLHYEFRINGIHRNPLTVKLPKTHPIPSQYKQHFLRHANKMLKMLRNEDNFSLVHPNIVATNDDTSKPG